MKNRLLPYILALCLLSSVASCNDGPRVIPRRNMTRIYAEMFVIDEQVAGGKLRRIADTTRVYEAIFQKYGYTADDFRYSQQKYLQDPQRYNRMLKKAKNIISAKLASLEALRDKNKRIEELSSELESYKKTMPRVSFSHHPDSLVVYDSLYFRDLFRSSFDTLALQKEKKDTLPAVEKKSMLMRQIDVAF